MLRFLFVVLKLLAHVSGFTNLTTIARGILPAEGVGNFVLDDDGITGMNLNVTVSLVSDFGATITGWIYTGDPNLTLAT
jgi:hypothetical protein